MNVLVVGGGASGLTSAIVLARRGFDITILERNNKCGKKLLLTGNGRCNYWNDNQIIDKYHSNNLDLFQEILENKDKVLDFFNGLGIIPKVINGYYYPYSNQANSILNALVNTATNLGVKFITEELVINIEKEEKFVVTTDKNKYVADKVVLATGSKAVPKTGSDGNGYSLVKSLGHSVTHVLPSLVQIVGNDNFYKEWNGVRSEVVLTLFQEGKMVKQEKGEVQFTDYGISGICTFNLSGFVAKGLDKGIKEEIFINFVPWFNGTKEELINFLNEQDKRLENCTLTSMLEGFLNYKIVNLILKLAHISKDQKWNEVSKEVIVDYLMNFKFNILNTKDYSYAQVCSGGVPLTEINTHTMESLKVKGLYLVGEILDVDGDCGGYNLGFAWMSGILAGESVIDD